MDGGKQLIRFLTGCQFLTESPALEQIDSASGGILRQLELLQICSEYETLEFLGKKLKLQVVSVSQLHHHTNLELDGLVALLSPRVCWQFRCLPYRRSTSGVHVLTSNPLDKEAHQLLEFVLQRPVIFDLAPDADIVAALQNVTPEELTDYDTFIDTSTNTVIEFTNPNPSSKNNPEAAEAPPIIKLCNKIVSDAITHQASDIHLEPTEDGLEVRFRVHGTMRNIFEIPKRVRSYVTARFKILAAMDISERRRPQDGRARARINGELTDIRVSSVPTAHGEKIVLRLLAKSHYLQSFDSLGMPASLLPRFLTDLNRRGRMILVTGPTGSGKSTTLYSCLQHLQDGTVNIETVEDPVEYRIKGINQIQVHEAAGVTFSSALRSILRQDPDVIMIGEIRDAETATIALQAAQTGHLVLSTLHTNDAVSAIQRLVQLGCPPYLVASSLAGILAQRLVRTLCPDCARPLSESERSLADEKIQKYELPLLAAELRTAGSCDACMQMGFAGRTGVYSYLPITERIESMILNGSESCEITAEAAHFGYQALRTGCIELLRQQRATLADVLPFIASRIYRESEGEAIQPASPEGAGIVSRLQPELQPARVLLVEDDAGVREVLCAVLQKDMFEVTEAVNGQDALKKVYESQPNLIICDLMMPVMDGKDFLLRLKRNQATSHIPILMLTAADTENNELDLLQLGADDFVSKTSSAAVMMMRVRRLLQ